MAIMDKIETFVEKHGYTGKSYALGLLVFPPICHYIACKKPGLPMYMRVLGNLPPIALGAIFFFLGSTIFQTISGYVEPLLTG